MQWEFQILKVQQTLGLMLENHMMIMMMMMSDDDNDNDDTVIVNEKYWCA